MHRRSKRILTGLGIVVVVLAVTYAVLLIRATAKLARHTRPSPRTDGPCRAAEILPPKVSDADNAAVLYQSAILLLKGQPAGDKSLYERLTAHLPTSAKTKAEMKRIARPGGGGQGLVAHRARDAPARVPARDATGAAS